MSYKRVFNGCLRNETHQPRGSSSAERERVAALTEKFLADGGEVKEIETGLSGITETFTRNAKGLPISSKQARKGVVT